MQNKPEKIIVHHDGVSREGKSFEIVNRYHRTLSFPVSSLGFFVGYHYWIELDGTLIQAREEHEKGAHTVGENWRSIGIGLAGNFDAEDPSKEQIATLGPLIARLCGRYQIPATAIYPHRKFTAKTCYGARLKDNWAAIVYLEHELARLKKTLKAIKPSLW